MSYKVRFYFSNGTERSVQKMTKENVEAMAQEENYFVMMNPAIGESYGINMQQVLYWVCEKE